MKAKTAMLVGLVLSMAGIADTAPDSNSIIKDNIEYYIHTDKSVYDLGEEVEILYRVTNLTDVSVNLGTLLPDPPDNYDLRIMQGNAQVWWYPYTAITAVIRDFILQPLETKEFQTTLDMMNDNGTPFQEYDDFFVTPGSYNVVGEVALSFGYERVPVSVSIEIIPEPPKTYYVNAADGSDNNDGLSPQTAFATIQKAIDTASNGDTVIVADGTYTGPGNRDIDFLGKAITVRSENGPENCIIDCNGTEDDPHRAFYFHNGEDANSLLNGFTIFGGHADGWSSSERSGGGIHCTESSPTITNCIIRGNSARYDGGAIYCERESNPTITNCIITGNSGYHGGGIYCSRQSHPTITNCSISGNTADGFGGAISLWDSSNPTITNCTITGNNAVYEGGAISCLDGPLGSSSPVITNCTITGNSSYDDGGGIYCRYSSPTITNCIISGNTAKGWGLVRCGGGGIYCGGYLGLNSSPIISNCIITGNSSDDAGGGIFYSRDSSSVITNCTITGNSAKSDGGGIYCADSSLTITNCILWDNEAPDGAEIYLERSSNASVSYTDVQGDQNDVYIDQDCTLNWGPGNINFDPCFVDPGYRDTNYIWVDGDYHLLSDSPCIDSGDNNSVPADIHDLDGDGNTAEPLPFDLDGNPRFVDRPDIEDTGNGTPPIVDMGAYEAMVSCFGVNHVKLGTKAGKKGNKVEVKGTFDPASPIDFAVDDVTYTIDDGLGYMLTFIIPAGSFEPEGKPDKQKFRFHSAKGSQPGIKARFDFLKCKFELKVKGVIDTSEITADTLAIVLQAGANLVEEVVQVQAKPKHLEFKREPKLNCCQM